MKNYIKQVKISRYLRTELSKHYYQNAYVPPPKEPRSANIFYHEVIKKKVFVLKYARIFMQEVLY